MSTQNKSNDNIWINDFQIIFTKPVDFFPTKSQTTEEKLNSIVRLSLYVSIILTSYHKNIKYLSIFIFVLFLTYIIYTNQPTTTPTLTPTPNTTSTTALTTTNFSPSKIEKLDGSIDTKTISPTYTNINPATCTKPTVDNPFMNFTMKDFMTFDSNGNTVNRAPACNINDPTIKKLSDATFNNDLYKDVSDIFGKLNSQRNFYTTPSTSIVNDQESFANWLYKNPYTCKENQDACINGNYEDLRSNRFVFPNPTSNPIDTKRLQK